MMAYAQGTTVTADRSRAELEKMLRRQGATEFVYGWQVGSEQLAFTLHGRSVRIDLPMPERDDPLFTMTPTGKRRTASAALEAWEAECRRRWRSLVLVVKAKLTAVADGISTVEREFLADLLMPDGRPFAHWAMDALPAISRQLTR